MRTKSINKKKVNIITLGCSKNVFDSEVLMGQLHANQFEVSHEKENTNAGIVIINTCGFIDSAKQESVNTILQFAQARKKGQIEKLIVSGCLSERYKTELEKEIPEVDAYFGTKELPHLLKILNADYKHELVGERILTTPKHYAYFKIAEGCDRPCSFCAIPLMRGKHVSFPMQELITNAQKLADNGVKELILIAQDLTYYGLDLYKERKLSELLNRLSDVSGIEWIRLHYAYPSGFPLDVIEVMKQKSNICKYLDIPLQHVSNKMLEAMRRGTTKEKTTALINDIRNKIPEIAIRTTLITGYPGETEKDFEELKDFVLKMRFDRLGVFRYSHEENTYAYAFKDDIPESLKIARANEIMQLQQEISLSHNQEKIGKKMKVFFDKKEGNHFVGRTEYDSPDVDNEVLLEAQEAYVRIGDFAEVEITGASEFDLFAKLI